MLKPVAENIWTLESELNAVLGLKMPVRATVLRLRTQELMVLSPVKTSQEDLEELRQYGPVRYVVAPNCMHHLFLKKFAAEFPKAEIWGPHCLQDKRNDIHFKGTLSTQETMPWEEDVDMIVVKAKAPMVQEFIFFHRASKTAIVTDLLFNVHDFRGWKESLIARLNGGYKKLAMTRLGRSVFNDKQSLHMAASHLLSWNPSHLVVAHGDVILNSAALALKEPLSRFAAINS
jgi:hypothetical protein